MTNQDKHNAVPFGTVSGGTLRPQDLLPTFYDALRWLDAKGAEGIICEVPEAAFTDDDHIYWGTEDPGFVIEELTEALEEFAPPFGYFGTNEGDGADFGFWPAIDALEDAARDGEVLKVGDTGEVPDDHRGYVMHVTDHGNVTLYRAVARLEEVWAVV